MKKLKIVLSLIVFTLFILPFNSVSALSNTVDQVTTDQSTFIVQEELKVDNGFQKTMNYKITRAVGQTYAETFPDLAFAKAVAESCASTNDLNTIVTQYDINICTTLYVTDSEIVDMSGIELLTELKTLKIHEVASSTIPDGIGQLTKLTTLDIRSNTFTSLPSTIGNLVNLTRLNLADSNITTLPDSFGNLKKLVALNYSNNGLTTVPDVIQNLTNLQSLELNNNNITSIPPFFTKLTKLNLLAMANNQIPEIPDFLTTMISLSSLYLSSNLIEVLPVNLTKLTNLRDLYLNSNKLTELPADLDKLANLRALVVDSNKIALLPNSICNLRYINLLDVSYNGLIELPQNFGNLKTLVTLYARNNLLTVLPTGFGGLTSLENLYLQDNQLQSLPQNFGNLNKLFDLDLSRNKITLLPDNFGNLSSLYVFQINDNKLEKLPDNFGNLSRLDMVHAANNQICNLPASIINLTNLQVFDLRFNLLPPEIDIILKQNGMTYYNGNHEQDYLVFDTRYLSFDISSQTDLDRINVTSLVRKGADNFLPSPNHSLRVNSYVDSTGNAVNINDYIKNGVVIKTGSVFVNVTDIDNEGIFTVNSSLTTSNRLQLNFKISAYNLIFDLNGSNNIAPATQILAENEAGTTVENPTRDGFVFTGWNTAANGTGTVWLPGTTPMIASDTTIYAQWEVSKYNLIFDLNGSNNIAPATQILAENEVGTTVQNPTRDGFVFTGWNTAANGTGTVWLPGTTPMLASDTTIYAQWEQPESSIIPPVLINQLPFTGNVSYLVFVIVALFVIFIKRYKLK